MKRTFQAMAALLVILLVLGVTHLAMETVIARDHLRNVVLKDLRTNHWRLGEGGESRPLTLTAGELGAKRLKWLLAAVEPDFYVQAGWNISAWLAGSPGVRQALVKVLIGGDPDPGPPSLTQAVLADFALNVMIPKNRQLDLYLNCAPLGPADDPGATQTAILGLPQGASTFFQKPVTALTDDQYLALIAMIADPDAFHLVRHPERNQARVTEIRALLAP